MARKPRQNRYFPEKTEAKWKAGVYARLSVSDNRAYGESLIHQLKLAQEFLLSKADISFVKTMWMTDIAVCILTDRHSNQCSMI